MNVVRFYIFIRVTVVLRAYNSTAYESDYE